MIAGLILEHPGHLSASEWGGFAVHMNMTRDSLRRLPVAGALIRSGDAIMADYGPRAVRRVTRSLRLRRLAGFGSGLTEGESVDLRRRLISALSTHRNGRPTVLYHHLNHFELPPSALLRIAESFNIIMVTTVLDLQEARFPENFTATQILARANNYEVTVRYAQSLIVSRQGMAREVEFHFGVAPERITVARLGADHVLAHSDVAYPVKRRLTQGKPYIYFPSKPWPHKGHRQFLGYLDHLDPKFSVVMPGNPNEIRAALGQANNASLSDRVILPGYLDDPTHYSLMRGASAVMMPTRYEGFGIPYGEAAMLGTPIVGFANEAAQELLGVDGALLVEPGDWKALAEGVSLLSSEPEIRESLTREARRRVVHLTWENYAKTCLDAYSRVLATGPTP